MGMGRIDSLLGNTGGSPVGGRGSGINDAFDPSRPGGLEQLKVPSTLQPWLGPGSLTESGTEGNAP